MCQECGLAKGTATHRWYFCSAGAEQRTGKGGNGTLPFAPSALPAPTREYGLVVVPPEVLKWKQQWKPKLVEVSPDSVKAPDCTIWTDGSAMHPQDEVLRTAGWGFAWLADLKWERKAGGVVGAQTVRRAELQVVVKPRPGR